MTEEYETIRNWAPIVGRWLFPNPADVIYASPQQQNTPFGICVSNIRFSEGDAKVTIQFPRTGDGATTTGEGRILLGYRSVTLALVLAVLAAHTALPNSIVLKGGEGWRSPEVMITCSLNVHTKYSFALADRD